MPDNKVGNLKNQMTLKKLQDLLDQFQYEPRAEYPVMDVINPVIDNVSQILARPEGDSARDNFQLMGPGIEDVTQLHNAAANMVYGSPWNARLSQTGGDPIEMMKDSKARTDQAFLIRDLIESYLKGSINPAEKLKSFGGQTSVQELPVDIEALRTLLMSKFGPQNKE